MNGIEWQIEGTNHRIELIVGDMCLLLVIRLDMI